MIRQPYHIVRNSKIHGRGVFAKRLIRKGTRVIEYTGPIVTEKQALDVGSSMDKSLFEYKAGSGFGIKKDKKLKDSDRAEVVSTAIEMMKADDVDISENLDKYIDLAQKTLSGKSKAQSPKKEGRYTVGQIREVDGVKWKFKGNNVWGRING